MKVRIQGVNFWGSQPIIRDTTTKAAIKHTLITSVTKSYYSYEIEKTRITMVQSRTEALNNQEAWYGAVNATRKPQAELLLNPFYKSEDPFSKYNTSDNQVEMTGARYTHKQEARIKYFAHTKINSKDVMRLIVLVGLLWLVYNFIYL